MKRRCSAAIIGKPAQGPPGAGFPVLSIKMRRHWMSIEANPVPGTGDIMRMSFGRVHRAKEGRARRSQEFIDHNNPEKSTLSMEQRVGGSA